MSVVAACSISGTVTDATTGLPIANPYVNVWDDADYYAALYTDDQGFYQADSLVEPVAYLSASAENHQPSFYPLGWPEGMTEVPSPASRWWWTSPWSARRCHSLPLPSRSMFLLSMKPGTWP